jgi:hypothetical protein
LQPTRLWPPVVWALVFTTINLYQLVRIYLERRPVTLSDDEQTLYDLAFRSLRPREFVSLVLIEEWKTAAAGDKVLMEGQAVSSICVAISGTVRVHREGRDVGVIDPRTPDRYGIGLDRRPVARGRDVHEDRPVHLLASTEYPVLHGQETRSARYAAGTGEPSPRPQARTSDVGALWRRDGMTDRCARAQGVRVDGTMRVLALRPYARLPGAATQPAALP